ncbi:MAG: SDR family oxidoreductase [Candidatus Uhrbacteria bacterium]|nr:SDR family oxidoreductase [Candidatus Uhrbacteria bacterium]
MSFIGQAIKAFDQAHMFANKVVIVTGGSSGIGAAITRQLVDAGAKVVIASISRGEQSRSDNVLFIETDVRDEDAVKKAIDETLKEFGKIDIVVNSAGMNYQDQRDITNFSLKEYHDVMDTNMTGIFLFTKYTLPHLLKTKGSIVNIASQLGLVPEPNLPVYSASKAAVVMFTKAMAVRYAALGIRINCVCPGPIDTAFLRKGFPVSKLPIGRLGTPDEVANVALFLASEKCSYVNGAAYTVDAGSSLARPRG